MAEMIQGQLYRVQVTSVRADETYHTDYLIVGNGTDDINLRFQYIVDVSGFDRYKITSIAKEAKAYVLREKLEKLKPNAPDITIDREFGSASFWQVVAGKPDSKKFEVTAQTTVYAKDCKHAIKKLSERLAAGSEHVIAVAEEVATASGFSVAKDMSMYPKASFVRG